jgi:hypothetical protein
VAQRATNRLIGLAIDHDLRRDATCRARLAISRNLASGKLDYVYLDERQLVALIADAARCLQVINRIR